MSSPDSSHVAMITRAAWERVCHTRACSGRQMALYLSKAMATRLNVDTLTDTPKQGRKKGSPRKPELHNHQCDFNCLRGNTADMGQGL